VPIANQYPLRVLLAEDNLINQKMMVMLMRKLGFELLVAVNGSDALKQLEREAQRGPAHEIECILMDASMDIMDGMECTRVIRAQQMPQRTRPYIIAQTANVTDEYRRRCMEAGMDQFTSKPVDVEKLIEALKQAYAYHHTTTAVSTSSSSVASSTSSTHVVE
jgi:CheY-like chemotaxis protein